MNNESELLTAIQSKLSSSESELMAELFLAVGEDFAVPQEPVQGGLRVLQNYLDILRDKICRSDIRISLKQDFERSGPVLVSLLAADAYFAALRLPAQATLGALIVKLGIDRVCSD